MRYTNTNEVFWGKEPDPKDFVSPLDPNFNKFLNECLNWYNYSATIDKKKTWFVSFVKIAYPKINVASIEAMNDGAFTTVGSLARMYMRGLDDSEYLNSKLKKYVGLLSEEGSEILRVKEEKKEARKKVVATDTRLLDMISFLEYEIDKFMTTKYRSTFDMNDWIRSASPSPIQHAVIKARFTKLLVELTNVDNDAQLTEGYSFLSKREKTRFIDFVSAIVETKKVRKTRVVRKKREKSPDKQISKLKYCDKDTEVGVESVDPRKMIGATSVWTWNKKYRMLGLYQSETDAGFAIKGSALTGFNEKTSISKKVRKPKELVPNILTMGKVPLKNVLAGIKSKIYPLRGRFNADTLILRVV